MKNINQTTFRKIEQYNGSHSGRHEGSSHEGGRHEGGSHEGGNHEGSRHEGGNHEDGNHEGREHDYGYSRSNHSNTGYLSGGDGWNGYYLDNTYIVDSPEQNITTISTPSTSTNQQANFIQPMVNPYDLLNNTEINYNNNRWKLINEPSECSSVQANWNDNNLSTDESCVCSSGNKASNIVNNKVVYKCQVSDQTPP